MIVLRRRDGEYVTKSRSIVLSDTLGKDRRFPVCAPYTIVIVPDAARPEMRDSTSVKRGTNANEATAFKFCFCGRLQRGHKNKSKEKVMISVCYGFGHVNSTGAYHILSVSG